MAVYFGGWRYAFFMPAVVLAVILVLFFLLQKNRPQDVGLPTIEEYHGEPGSDLNGGVSLKFTGGLSTTSGTSASSEME